uniref:Uncharacterized protein n=1 Tax=Panagrellus redivivus TaxID=6233 RepID=A0A7E5A005_PANRE
MLDAGGHSNRDDHRLMHFVSKRLPTAPEQVPKFGFCHAELSSDKRPSKSLASCLKHFSSFVSASTKKACDQKPEDHRHNPRASDFRLAGSKLLPSSKMAHFTDDHRYARHCRLDPRK